MQDLTVAIGLVLAVEGLLSAAFPNALKRAMMSAATTPAEHVRIIGLISAVLGTGLIWFVKFG
jgi:uncharacterized protein